MGQLRVRLRYDSPSDAADEFWGPVNVVVERESPLTGGERFPRKYSFLRHEYSNDEAVEEFCEPDTSACDSDWLLVDLWGEAMNDVCDELDYALGAYDVRLTQEANQGIEGEMSLMAPEVESLALRCPDPFYEAAWFDMETFWNGLCRTCQWEDLGSLLGGLDECG